MNNEITWGVPRPVFGRLKHAFVKGRSLCGKFNNEPHGQLEKGHGLVCTSCQKAAAKISVNSDGKEDE